MILGYCFGHLGHMKNLTNITGCYMFSGNIALFSITSPLQFIKGTIQAFNKEISFGQK